MIANFETFAGQRTGHAFAVEVADCFVADNGSTPLQKGPPTNSTDLSQKMFANMNGIGPRPELDCDNTNRRIHRLGNKVINEILDRGKHLHSRYQRQLHRSAICDIPALGGHLSVDTLS